MIPMHIEMRERQRPGNFLISLSISDFRQEALQKQINKQTSKYIYVNNKKQLKTMNSIHRI